MGPLASGSAHRERPSPRDVTRIVDDDGQGTAGALSIDGAAGCFADGVDYGSSVPRVRPLWRDAVVNLAAAAGVMCTLRRDGYVARDEIRRDGHADGGASGVRTGPSPSCRQSPRRYPPTRAVSIDALVRSGARGRDGVIRCWGNDVARFAAMVGESRTL